MEEEKIQKENPQEKHEESLEDVGKQLEKCAQERDEYLNGWKRARADFLNYKKEEMGRMGELMQYANEEIFLKMLPILDNLERAAKEIPAEQEKNQIMQGFLRIIIQLKEFLKGQGIEEVKTLGEKFNAAFHEAVGEIEGGESGIIGEEVEKGYIIHGRLLRPAKVKVAK